MAHRLGGFLLCLRFFFLNRAAVGWAVSCSAFGLFFLTALPKGGRGSRIAFGFLNRAAVGWAVSCSAFGLLTALPKAGAVLELPSVFLTALPKAGAVLELPSVF